MSRHGLVIDINCQSSSKLLAAEAIENFEGLSSIFSNLFPFPPAPLVYFFSANRIFYFSLILSHRIFVFVRGLMVFLVFHFIHLRPVVWTISCFFNEINYC